MEGQLSIWDFIPKEGFCDNKIINDLVDELKQLFPEIEIESYGVWQHVPNLGKRLFCFVEHYPIDIDIEPIREKWLKRGLEISISLSPNFEDDWENIHSYDAYISTLWKTKGHKETK